MLNIVENKKIEDGFSMEALESYGLGGGAIFGGFIVANIANTLINKARKKTDDSILISGGMAAGGLVGAMAIPNKYAKLACLGLMTYGLAKTASIALKEVTAPAADPTAAPGTPGAASGLAGLLPETLKAKLRSYIPTIGSVDQLIGDDMNGDDVNGDEFGNLDEMINGTDDINGNEEQTYGVGSVEAALL